MTEKVFAEGLALILAAMPNLKPEKATLDIWRNLLNDLPDDEFKTGVVKFCQDCEEIYPGTNIVAKIRKAAWEALPSGERLMRLMDKQQNLKLLRTA